MHLQNSSTITNEKIKTESKRKGKTGHYLKPLFSDSVLTLSCSLEDALLQGLGDPPSSLPPYVGEDFPHLPKDGEETPSLQWLETAMGTQQG